MATGELIKTSREVPVTEIPSGYVGTLPAGSSVRVTQSLGGNYTVMTETGQMLRIAAQDVDAIGETPELAPATGSAPDAPFSEQAVWDQLRTVYDPEIPVNIVELGLVYECQPTPAAEGGQRIDIKMSLTAPGCGMSDVLRRDV